MMLVSQMDGSSETERAVPGTGSVSRRPFPYPYRALLAICSDVDETPDRHVYWQIMRFLNTTANTSMGPGVGLEVGNSIYFDMPADQFSYWNTDDAGRAMVRALIRSGHIDCLHSFGDLATTRAHAARAVEELARQDCRLEVWVDHAVAPSNFGADIMRGSGDVSGSAAYHADLTCGFGVQYVWRGRVTSVTGQEVPPRLRGIYERRHPFASAKTTAKEALKTLLARAGNAKYAMHGDNRVLREVRLRDGQRVYEFLRANPYWAGVDRGATADGLAGVLIEPFLERLVERSGVCVLYTHLGKVARRDEPLGPRTRSVLRELAERTHAGKILVTTTRRLLGYCRASREVSFSSNLDAGRNRIDIVIRGRDQRYPLSEDDLSGLTLYVPDPERTRVTLDGREITGLQSNPADHTGLQSVSLPWKRLEFPDP